MKAKAERGRTLQLVGLGLLLCSTYIYALAVDRAWYAVNGIARIAAESRGLVRWRFISHALALSNGGMRSQSWAFVVFPIMFWTAVSVVVIGSFLVFHSRRVVPASQRAVARLRGRLEASLERRRQNLNALYLLLALASVIALAGIITFHNAPAASALEDAQITAGNWRMRLDEMPDDRQLMIHTDDQGGRFGEFVTQQEAEALVRQDGAELARETAANAADCEAAGRDDCGEKAAVYSLLRGEWKALTKSDVVTRTAEAESQWQDTLGSFDGTSIGGVALCIVFLVLLGGVAHFVPRVVAAGFRGFDPHSEDPLFPAYTRLGQILIGAAAVIVVLGLAATAGEQPGGIAVAIIFTMLVGAVGVFAIGQVLLAPRALARLRDPQMAAQSVVASRDRATLAEIAKLDASAVGKQRYVATLQAAASPSDLVANAQAELHAAQQAADELRGRLLGPALQAATSRLQAASAQHFALRAQRAPAEAFGAVDGAIHSARAEIAQLARAAGWSPLPVTPAESAVPEGKPLLPVGATIGSIVLVGIVGAVAVLSRPHQIKAPASISTTPTAQIADSRCSGILDDYQRALTVAADSAGALEKAGCARPSSDGSLMPAQPTPQCQSLWTTQFANAQRATGLNGQARAACPGMNIPSMGTVPPSLRVAPNSVAESPQPGVAVSSPPAVSRRDFTSDGVSLSAVVPVGAVPASRWTGKGTMHAEVTWPSLPSTPYVDITDWQGAVCTEDAQLVKGLPAGVLVQQHEAGDRELFYFKNPDGSYSATVCATSVGYHCEFDSVPAAIALDALEVCKSVQRVGKAQVIPVADDASNQSSGVKPTPSSDSVARVSGQVTAAPDAAIKNVVPLHEDIVAAQPATPVTVHLTSSSGTFEVLENGKVILSHGPADIEVVPGHPRTLLIRGIDVDGHHTNLRDKTIIVDGDSALFQFEQEHFSDCRNKVSEPTLPECQRQFCELHATDPACAIE